MQPQNKMGLRTKNPDLMFFFFCGPTTKMWFHVFWPYLTKNADWLCFLQEPRGSHLHITCNLWAGLAWLSHSQILNHFEWTESQDIGISPKMCGFVSRITTGELGSVEKNAWICQTFLPPHGLGPSNHPEKPRPGHRTVLFWGSCQPPVNLAMSSIHYLYDFSG